MNHEGIWHFSPTETALLNQKGNHTSRCVKLQQCRNSLCKPQSSDCQESYGPEENIVHASLYLHSNLILQLCVDRASEYGGDCVPQSIYRVGEPEEPKPNACVQQPSSGKRSPPANGDLAHDRQKNSQTSSSNTNRALCQQFSDLGTCFLQRENCRAVVLVQKD